MYKPINGWTKEKILNVIRARKQKKAAYDKNTSQCKYLTKDGNKCAVGLFIPDGHQAQNYVCDVINLITSFPTLIKNMPLETYAMKQLQKVYDNEGPKKSITSKFEGNAKAAMLDWVERNVE